ncbi:MAG: hypothetical protein ACFE8E_09005 [Candidatus Hodarchaeota archaeon]
MTQESWKYLINGSYVMLASLFLPIGYSSLCCPTTHIFIWVFFWIWVDNTIRVRWFFEIQIIPNYWYSWFYWILPLISILVILVGSISIIISARMIRKGKKASKGIFTLIIFLQFAILLINLIAYFGQVFFGYLSFLFALILLIKGNRMFLTETKAL